MPKIKIGDKIRILVDRLSSADVKAGDILTVEGRDPSYINARDPAGRGTQYLWTFNIDRLGTGFEIVSEEAPGQPLSTLPDTLTISGIEYVRKDFLEKSLKGLFND